MKGFFKAKGINGAINIGAFISFITSFMIFLPFFLPSSLVSNNIFYTVINIFIAIMWLIISVGIYKKIQICAWLSIFFYIVNQCAIIIDTGYTRFNLLWPLGIYFFCCTVVAVRLSSRERKEGISLEYRLRKDAFKLFIAMVLVFGAGVFISIKINDYLVQNLWGEYVKAIEVERERSKLPIKIDNNVTLMNFYIEDKSLVMEYDTKNLKTLNATEWYDKTKSDFKRFCWVNVIQVKGFQVIYRFTQGYEKREFKYNVLDCRN